MPVFVWLILYEIITPSCIRFKIIFNHKIVLSRLMAYARNDCDKQWRQGGGVGAFGPLWTPPPNLPLSSLNGIPSLRFVCLFVCFFVCLLVTIPPPPLLPNLRTYPVFVQGPLSKYPRAVSDYDLCIYFSANLQSCTQNSAKFSWVHLKLIMKVQSVPWGASLGCTLVGTGI